MLRINDVWIRNAHSLLRCSNDLLHPLLCWKIDGRLLLSNATYFWWQTYKELLENLKMGCCSLIVCWLLDVEQQVNLWQYFKLCPKHQSLNANWTHFWKHHCMLSITTHVHWYCSFHHYLHVNLFQEELKSMGIHLRKPKNQCWWELTLFLHSC